MSTGNMKKATTTVVLIFKISFVCILLLASWPLVITKDKDHLLLASGVLELFVVSVPSILIGKPQPQSAKQSRICFIIPPSLRNVRRAVHRCV